MSQTYSKKRPLQWHMGSCGLYLYEWVQLRYWYQLIYFEVYNTSISISAGSYICRPQAYVHCSGLFDVWLTSKKTTSIVLMIDQAWIATWYDFHRDIHIRVQNKKKMIHSRKSGHPCAGAMLIFSVSFQLLIYATRRKRQSLTILKYIYYNTIANHIL